MRSSGLVPLDPLLVPTRSVQVRFRGEILGQSAAVEFLGNLRGSHVLQISTPTSLQILFTITYLPFTVPPRYVRTQAITFMSVIDLVMADKLGFLDHPREIRRTIYENLLDLKTEDTSATSMDEE
jgi:hypothetical protein